ncbi:MAG: glycosyltransferase family 4 protein [Candidatus Omnitrophica bacterium]|nr:glycosyltransferase family 4 protein [Candidatus Omnitrophota bacterium]MCM8831804.1 glycosyltransferase family 4 protein [Candidatus Omnitrophota bacterium]
MKILQTPARFYPYRGGVENYVYYLSKELVKLGNSVKVICANQPFSKKEDKIDGIKVYRLSYIAKIANTNITLSLPIALFKENFDILHTHLPHPWSADWSAFFSVLKKKPLVLTYHDDIVGNNLNYYVAKSYNLSFLKVLLRSAKKIIVTQKKYIERSLYLKNYLKKILVIPPGVDLEEFKPLQEKKNDEKIILFLGILDEFHSYKGLDFLIKAFVVVKEKILNTRLLIGGEGILKKHYQKLVSSLKLEDRVNFLGFIPQEKLISYYNSCDVFVLPSVSEIQEGFGLVLLEALACAKPVVATDVVGVAKDIREFKAGIIVKPQGVKELAEAIIQILSDEKLAKQMGKSGLELVRKNYNWTDIARKILELYHSVV